MTIKIRLPSQNSHLPSFCPRWPTRNKIRTVKTVRFLQKIKLIWPNQAAGGSKMMLRWGKLRRTLCCNGISHGRGVAVAAEEIVMVLKYNTILCAISFILFRLRGIWYLFLRWVMFCHSAMVCKIPYVLTVSGTLPREVESHLNLTWDLSEIDSYEFLCVSYGRLRSEWDPFEILRLANFQTNSSRNSPVA